MLPIGTMMSGAFAASERSCVLQVSCRGPRSLLLPPSPSPPLPPPLQDWGRADRTLSSAASIFTQALSLVPNDTRALGNLGNALLAQVSEAVMGLTGVLNT
jgi:hypothetical protein